MSTEQEALEKAQMLKKRKLSGIVLDAKCIITKIDKINQKIEQANQCSNIIKSIPGMFEGSFSSMRDIATNLQQGLLLDGTPVGSNVLNDVQNISGSITSSVAEIGVAIFKYCEGLSMEGAKLKKEANNKRTEYNNVSFSYPVNLGKYAPAPAFPHIPEIKTFGG